MPPRPPATTKGGHKVALIVGAGLAIALANTELAPLIVALLTGGIVYQVIQLTGGK